jgi:hypothetical protein
MHKFNVNGFKHYNANNVWAHEKQLKNSFDTKNKIWKYFFNVIFLDLKNINLDIVVLRKN